MKSQLNALTSRLTFSLMKLIWASQCESASSFYRLVAWNNFYCSKELKFSIASQRQDKTGSIMAFIRLIVTFIMANQRFPPSE
jgi:hypothetical protein